MREKYNSLLVANCELGLAGDLQKVAVEIHLPTVLRQYSAGSAVVEADGETLRELIADLDRKFPGLGDQLVMDGDLHRFVNVYLNDEDVRYLGKLDTRVTDDDVISILPAVAGG